ncbi:hypothetical protein DNTS_035569 [Danionella cerebrum]|uniref:Uncharacterized protein n=1 Tax=Danionella cerebrum TaxID=2873325 RepID=A0A553QMT0_9TELE|nr:hypothetical protein DNTS_035569 [Danionella translucida]
MRQMTGNMQKVILMLLLITLLNHTAAFSMEPLQKTSVLAQSSDSQQSQNMTLGDSKAVRFRNLGFRLKRANSANTKKPARFCAGCFSVIGDPTRPGK